MAPVDRREHRQQRMRGAGAANVDTAFAFNLGALTRPSKQASLPPQISSRRTPVRTTPQASNGSSRRHRSASFQRSSAVKKRPSPQQSSVTPKLGKRKRGSQNAAPSDVDDGEPDPLSPEIDEFRSVEKARRTAAPVSPIFEGPAEMVDELSVDMDIEGSPKASGSTVLVRETPTRLNSEDGPGSKQTPILDSTGPFPEGSSQSAIRSIRRSPRTTGSVNSNPSTPQAEKARQSSAAKNIQSVATPAATNGSEADEISEDELSPLPSKMHAKATKSKVLTPKQPTPKQVPSLDANISSRADVEDNLEVDTETRASPLKDTSPAAESSITNIPPPIITFTERSVTSKTRKQSGMRRYLDIERDVVQTSPPSSTPRQVGKTQNYQQAEEASDKDVDELSPDHSQAKRRRKTAVGKKQGAASKSVGVKLRHGQDRGANNAVPGGASRPKPSSPPKDKRKQKSDANNGDAPVKRQKHGPTQKITVMRLKGFGLNGLTVVDTTRSAIESLLNNQMIKLTGKLADTTDPAQQRDMRSQRNVILAYRDKLDDSFLDLQDANNSAVDNVNKLRQYKKEKKRLQNEYLTIQAERDQLALENDDLTAAFQQEKQLAENRHKLSNWMYDIQSAIQKGKTKARKEDKENQGPDLSVKMLLDDVTRETAGTGGLLSFVKKFNGMLERSAGILEGRI